MERWIDLGLRFDGDDIDFVATCDDTTTTRHHRNYSTTLDYGPIETLSIQLKGDLGQLLFEDHVLHCGPCQQAVRS